jgi:hypothetical protein
MFHDLHLTFLSHKKMMNTFFRQRFFFGFLLHNHRFEDFPEALIKNIRLNIFKLKTGNFSFRKYLCNIVENRISEF